MKFILDFCPIVLFFLSYKFWGIYPATGVAMGASFIQLLGLRWKTGKFETVSVLTFLSITILGTATLLLQDERFIKWKPTVVYGILSIVFITSPYFSQGTPLIQRMMGTHVFLNKPHWHRLNTLWSLFFLMMGLLNVWVVYHFTTETWVQFKLFGTLIITFIFILLQGIYLVKHKELS